MYKNLKLTSDTNQSAETSSIEINNIVHLLNAYESVCGIYKNNKNLSVYLFQKIFKMAAQIMTGLSLADGLYHND